MDFLLEKLWKHVAKNTSLNLRVRLFRLMCLITGIVCLFIVLPVNLLEVWLPLAVNIAVIAVGLFGAWCYTQSVRGRNHIVPFLLVLILILVPVWFLNGGIGASVTFYFFPVMILPLVLCQGRTRWILLALSLTEACGLILTEYFHRSWVVLIPDRFDLMLDDLAGVVACFVAITLIVWVIITNYDWEQTLLARYARELAASEENYRSVVENVMSIILRLDPQGNITFFNKFAEELFGYKRHEIIGRSALGTIVPAVSSKGEDLAAKFKDLVKNPAKYSLTENENRCRDDRRIWVTWTNQPIYDEQGALREILCAGTDVTPQVELMEQLRLTQFTMDAAAESVVWTNEQGRIIYANAATVNELGYPAPELHALTLSDLAVDFPAAAWEKLWQSLKQNRSATFELQQRRQSGTTRFVELAATYLKVAGKECTIIFIRDLTERKLAEERRRRHEQEKQQIQRLESLGVLAGGIAHDFNNLLTAILGNISMVRMDGPRGNGNDALLAEAEKASLKARELTARLLTFSKGGKPVKSAVNLGPVLRDSISLVLRDRPVKCDLDLPADLRPVNADAAQLTHVFNNLIINACQAITDQGRITLRARNRTLDRPENQLAPGGDYVEVTVQDNGCGIAAENLSKIFDPYFTTKKNASGLGLTVVHSVISQHHGAVSVDSKPGTGTTFTLLLPVSRQSPPATLPPTPSGKSSGHRILIMDDELMICRVLSKMLTRLGYQVETAPDGDTALHLYQHAATQGQAFDLLIMDLTVPGGMGGKETIERLKQINPRVRSIVSSGYSDDPILADHQAHGFNGVIHKPYSHEQVVTSVRQALES